MAFQQLGNTWVLYWVSTKYKANFCHVTKSHFVTVCELGANWNTWTSTTSTKRWPPWAWDHLIRHSIYPKPHTNFCITVLYVVAAKHCSNLLSKYIFTFWIREDWVCGSLHYSWLHWVSLGARMRCECCGQMERRAYFFRSEGPPVEHSSPDVAAQQTSTSSTCRPRHSAAQHAGKPAQPPDLMHTQTELNPWFDMEMLGLITKTVRGHAVSLSHEIIKKQCEFQA